MEFRFDVEAAMRAVAQTVSPTEQIAVINGEKFRGASPQVMEQVKQVIDAMGHASGKAQKLPSTITSFGKLQANGHIIFIKSSGSRCIGFIKVGYKKLFVRGRGGEMVEMKPLSVLDFYVDSTVQRGGYGRKLFDAMLAEMKSEPAVIAYDRPSSKLIGFLGKHFNLHNYVQQNNNYVVFDDYFVAIKKGTGQSTGSPQKVDNQRQRSTAYDTQSAFGQSHMTSFQKAGTNAPLATQQNNYNQHQTLSAGWASQGMGQEVGAPSAQMQTSYPRQSHHTQSFQIGHAQSEQKKQAIVAKPHLQPQNLRTQANTFGLNSNSIVSNNSGMFEQTHSSNGFGSTFLSSNGGVRQSQHALPAQHKTQLKFGNVGQEMLGGSGNATRKEQDAQNTLNDFKQSFNLNKFQRQGGNGSGEIQPDGSGMFQTSYQSQFPIETHHQKAQRQVAGASTLNASQGQPGYSPFQAFANRQQSLPTNQAVYSQINRSQNNRQSEFRTLNGNNSRQPGSGSSKHQYVATFQGGINPANQHIFNGSVPPQQSYTSHQKAYSVPATQRTINTRSNTQQQIPNGNHYSNSYSAGSNTFSPVVGGSRAAQFLQHQNQFQDNGIYQTSSTGLLQKHQGGGQSVWQSQDTSSSAYRDAAFPSGGHHRGLRF